MPHVTRILLVGNPNAGKSTLFNKLTGGHAKVGNWHGVTVGAEERQTTLCGEKVTVCDLPGIYSLESISMEETFTRDYLLSHEEDAVVFVSECAGLARSLPLFFSLLKNERRAALVLTKKKLFEREGGRVDADALEKRLGIPVLIAERFTKKQLKTALCSALESPVSEKAQTAALPEGVLIPAREGLSRADRVLLNGWVCIPAFFASVFLIFFLTFAPGLLGDRLKSLVETLFTEVLAGCAQSIASPVARSFVIDGILNGLGGVLCFLPQIALLFFFLILMEESGFLSRLAFLTDGFFSRLGLNGRAVFSLLLGFGCTAAAALTTRGLDDKKIQRRVLLCLPYIPCSAKLPVFLALSASLFRNPFLAVLLLYALGISFSLFAAFLLKGKEKPPFVMELAPLQLPRPLFVFKSLLFQIKQFIIKVATVVLAFFLLSWLLSSFSFSFEFCAAEESMLAGICGGLKYLFAPIGMCDWKIAYAALSGLVAKENVAGALNLFYGGFPYSFASAFAFAVFLLTCSPCVSAIAATAKEAGWKRALSYSLVQTASALLLSYLTYFLLRGGAIYLAIAAAPVLAIIIFGKKKVETIRRKRKAIAQKLHR